jgi:hypothetical protein
LLDLLRDKGVLTAEEYKQLKAAEERGKAETQKRIEEAKPPFNVRYKNGMRITSKDKRHELKIAPEFYTQFSAFPEETDADGNFLIRRARVSLQGRLFGDWTYRLTLEGTGDKVLSSTTYLGWERFKEFRIRVGQNLAPFGGEANWSRFNLFLLERSMIGDQLRESVSRGVFVFSDPHPAIHLRASVTNGNGTNDDDNNEKDFSLRVAGKPFQAARWHQGWPIEAAGNVSIGRQPHNASGGLTRLVLRDNRLAVFDAATEGLRTRFGGDLSYNKEYRKQGLPFSALAEFIYESQEREGPVLGSGNADLIRYGYSVQAGYLLMGEWKKNGLEAAARYDSIDVDDPGRSRSGVNLAGQTVNTLSLGLTYRPIAQVRVSLNGFLIDIDRPATTALDRDPFKNGGGAWAVLSGIYFKY